MLSIDELRELPFDPDYNGSAVYFLWRGPKLCYIGRSGNFGYRIEQHEAARDGFTGAKAIPFDTATYIPCPFPNPVFISNRESGWMLVTEARYLYEYKPPFNVRIPSCRPY